MQCLSEVDTNRSLVVAPDLLLEVDDCEEETIGETRWIYESGVNIPDMTFSFRCRSPSFLPLFPPHLPTLFTILPSPPSSFSLSSDPCSSYGCHILDHNPSGTFERTDVLSGRGRRSSKGEYLATVHALCRLYVEREKRGREGEWEWEITEKEKSERERWREWGGGGLEWRDEETTRTSNGTKHAEFQILPLLLLPRWLRWYHFPSWEVKQAEMTKEELREWKVRIGERGEGG